MPKNLIMKDFFEQLGQFKDRSKGKIPSVSKTKQFISALMEFLFPVIAESDTEVDSELQYQKLTQDLKSLLCSIAYSEEKAEGLSLQFIKALPRIYQWMIEDAEAIYQGDPAAETMEEVILTYPGFMAVSIYRLSHELYHLEVPLIPRIMSEYAHALTGVEIHPGAQIGNPFCIDHGGGVVIGQTTKIGNRVKIYQGVTLGALSVNKKDCKSKRHPTIEDDVTIYAGATILGGATTIGRNSVIGGNVWLVKSVPKNSKVIHNAQITIL